MSRAATIDIQPFAADTGPGRRETDVRQLAGFIEKLVD
jgi:hypothetical protein